MKNKGIIIFLILLGILIVAIIVGDFVSDRPDKREANPFEYNVDEFKEVDPELILYRETKNFNIGFEKPAGIAVHDDRIYITGDRSIKIINRTGQLLLNIDLNAQPTAVDASGNKVFVAVDNQIVVYDKQGNMLKEWEHPGENSILTSIAIADSIVFVADAGNRRVMKYSDNGELLLQFEGKTSDEVLHGFIIPSPYFDLDVNSFGELWVVNPGMHALENYTFDGAQRGYWENTGIKIEGFSGCCNPAHFTFLPDGSFVTSEKGMVRIKVYKPSGELFGVVAPPKKFNDDGEAPDLSTDAEGNVFALDFDRKTLRVFEPKE
jgi:hypothetical protein